MKALVKLKHFFSSCMGDEVIDELDSEPLRVVTRKIRSLLPLAPLTTPFKADNQLPPSLPTYEHDLTAVLAYMHSLGTEPYISAGSLRLTHKYRS